MNGQEEAQLKVKANVLNLRENKTKKGQQPVLSKIRCIGDLELSNELEFASMGLNKE